MPSKPMMCMGKKVKLKPMKMSQKPHTDSHSCNMRPVNFGNQWWIPASNGKTTPPINT